jgi:hypothetical protein
VVGRTFTFKRNYGRLAILPECLEVDVGGANRMVAYWEEGLLHLLDVGGHETIPAYDKSKFSLDKHQRISAPGQFWPEVNEGELRFFTRNPCPEERVYGDEGLREWLYYLSDQQTDATTEIFLNHVDELRTGKSVSPTFIVGGPGTGKTSVLINLLKEFTNAGLIARIVLSQAVANYVQACLPALDISKYLYRQDGVFDIALVDDPKDEAYIRAWLEYARSGSLKTAIIAFDPCQLSSFNAGKKTTGVSDLDFDTLMKEFRIDPFELTACYRQKENVGRAARKTMEMVARSAPFVDSAKVANFQTAHESLTALSNNLEYPNPHGYLQVYQNAGLEQMMTELRRIIGLPLWTHWPALLVVIDSQLKSRTDCGLSQERIRLLLRAFNAIKWQLVWTDDVESVKGLEYQHAFIVIGSGLFDELENGFKGSGQRIYNQRRLIRIPYSRAKDSMVVFVV